MKIPLPPDTRLALTGVQPGPPAISPDGKQIAFAADGAPGERNLWVRDLHEARSRLVQNTSGASYPFWSPDGRDIGFFADSKLKRVSSTGGSVVTLADAPSGKGGTWNRDGMILFCPSFNAPLYRIPASGGVEAEQVTTLEMDRGDASHRFPQFMDDGNHFIYLVRNRDDERSEVLYGALDRESSTVVVKTETNAYVVDDTIFYLKDRMLMAHDFDQETGQISGVPIPIAEGVRMIELAGRMVVAAGDGALLFQTGDLTMVSQFLWLDRAGNRLGTLGEAVFLAEDSSPAVSPDGSRIAYSDYSLWIMEVATGNRERIAFADGIQLKPVWSPDGRTVAYASNENGPYQIIGKDLESGSETTVMVPNDDPEVRPWPEAWIGNDLVYVTEELTSGETKIWSLTLGEESPSLVAASHFRNPLPRVSPDGRWMAYGGPGQSSPASIFVVDYPEARRQWEVVQGARGFWSGDGSVYFYRDLRGVLMSTAVRKSRNSFEWDTPTTLFHPSGEIIGLYGDQVLAVESHTSDSAADSSFEAILNWEALVDQR